MDNNKAHRSIDLKGAAALCIALAALCAGTPAAQNGFNLPYSQFGIGISEVPFNMPVASRMGGAVYTRTGNNTLNPLNPASYGGIEPESFVFDMGLNIQLATATEAGRSQHDADGNLGYLAVGFPLTRWWKVAAGLMPYSTVDYMSVAQGSGMKTTYDGTGGINELFVGSAFNLVASPRQRLQAGFNVNYLAGSIERAITYASTDTTLHSLNSRKQKDTRVSNVVFDLGLQYSHALNEHYTLAIGLTYKPYRDMSVSETALIYTYASSTSSEVLLDTVFPARGEAPEIESRIEQPHTFGLGLSLERNGLWQVAADATFAGWQGLRITEDASHQVFGNNALGEGPFSRYALGFEKKVHMDAPNYWGRIGWSLGGHADCGVMYLDLGSGSRRIDQWGIGAGASLPMRKGKSLLTISVGYNSLGSTDLLQYSTLTFGIAVSSCERWFAKRKYN